MKGSRRCSLWASGIILLINTYLLPKEHTKTTLDEHVGFIVLVEGTKDHFVVGLSRKFAVVQWDGIEGSKVTVVKELGEVDHHLPKNIINDGKADPRGRIFAGTMGHEESPGDFQMHQGSLYRLDGKELSKICDKISISNGLAWDEKEGAMYYIDSLEFNIRRYDYDIETGECSNMKHIFDLKELNIDGLPDGCIIDTDGNLWVALFTGSSIIKIDPRSGKLLQQVPIPAKQVTSATFGGPNFDILFVTTGSMNIDGEQKPPCGATFMVTGLGV